MILGCKETELDDEIEASELDERDVMVDEELEVTATQLERTKVTAIEMNDLLFINKDFRYDLK
jgi:hypothetical protein